MDTHFLQVSITSGTNELTVIDSCVCVFSGRAAAGGGCWSRWAGPLRAVR